VWYDRRMFAALRYQALAVALATAALVLVSGADSRVNRSAVRASAAEPQAPADSVASEEDVRAQCGVCHAVPPPDVLPRSAWRESVARMMLIRDGLPEPVGPAGTAARMVPLSPELQRVARYYLQNAPERLPPPTPWPDADGSGFTVHGYTPPAGAPPLPAIAHVRFLDLDGDGRLDVLATDTRQGLVLTARWGRTRELTPAGHLKNPSHAELFDFDGNGTKDLLIADLGSFQPANHTDGAVVWMRGLAGGKFAPLSLPGWPRVADVQPGDFNADGKADLAVAAFGWRTVGRLSVLENTTRDYARPSFAEHVIDPRSGSIHAIPVDINDDGRLDIVGLIAQQYETVVAYISTGSGFAFEPQTIYTAPHPNWGSSGIQLIDMDEDKDLDVLLTHGDTLDDHILKPYHGILWLENTGTYPFVAHRIADLPGVLRAQAGDLDGDGDLDVVACAFISGTVEKPDAPGAPSLVWLERTAPGTFVKHTLERRPPRHATLDLGDEDGDGDLDILVGSFLVESQDVPWVEVWENKRKAPGGL
jgi:hypothetical protein